MNRAKARNIAISSVPAALLILIADMAAPGWGRFINPVWLAKAQIAKLDRGWRELQPPGEDDPRLEACQQVLSENTVGNTQEQLRGALTGETEQIAVQWLGPPTCQLANDTYRWLTESGLSIDVIYADDGEVQDARLTR
ncbi:hypothetical protein XM38_012350 [Halomicronema hongdechloris C2206]|uniref:Uncharacterized protein n=1 Tax=Halomicronema hongdechloris C2206 TaxID=1641165 RepID=A0A1Z3HJ21_9CYAN|nr:hypothetical protein [Halomicronema hongdechloris]ASC70298.1 hypothetical protein XM38_012350 [Halomicronema hongdechloris C2206]